MRQEKIDLYPCIFLCIFEIFFNSWHCAKFFARSHSTANYFSGLQNKRQIELRAWLLCKALEFAQSRWLKINGRFSIIFRPKMSVACATMKRTQLRYFASHRLRVQWRRFIFDHRDAQVEHYNLVETARDYYLCGLPLWRYFEQRVVLARCSEMLARLSIWR